MEIRIESLLEGARRAEGTVIVIDVYRAFTTSAIAFSRGAKKIILVAEVEDALELKRQGIGDLCMGEVGGERPEGFDFGNSPFEMSTADVEGKTLIQSTRAGTVGADAARKAERLYVSSLVVAKATACAVQRDRAELITIVAMGLGGYNRTDEDEVCALYLRNIIEGRSPDPKAVRSLILAGASSQNFDDAAQPWMHAMDREIALRVNSVPFAMTVNRQDGMLVARRDGLGNS